MLYLSVSLSPPFLLLFAFLHPLLHHPAVLLFRIARSSLTADSRAARKPAVFIYGIETPPFCIFIILPQLEAGFCMYYVVGHVLSILLGTISFFSKEKKEQGRGVGRSEILYTRDCSIFRFFYSSM